MTKRFDRYEIRLVRKYVNDIMPALCDPPEEALYVRYSWTLYGHLKGEGVRAIFDSNDYAGAVEMYSLITGDYELTGVDIYNTNEKEG